MSYRKKLIEVALRVSKLHHCGPRGGITFHWKHLGLLDNPGIPRSPVLPRRGPAPGGRDHGTFRSRDAFFIGLDICLLLARTLPTLSSELRPRATRSQSSGWVRRAARFRPVVRPSSKVWGLLA